MLQNRIRTGYLIPLRFHPSDQSQPTVSYTTHFLFHSLLSILLLFQSAPAIPSFRLISGRIHRMFFISTQNVESCICLDSFTHICHIHYAGVAFIFSIAFVHRPHPLKVLPQQEHIPHIPYLAPPDSNATVSISRLPLPHLRIEPIPYNNKPFFNFI